MSVEEFKFLFNRFVFWTKTWGEILDSYKDCRNTFWDLKVHLLNSLLRFWEKVMGFMCLVFLSCWSKKFYSITSKRVNINKNALMLNIYLFSKNRFHVLVNSFLFHLSFKNVYFIHYYEVFISFIIRSFCFIHRYYSIDYRSNKYVDQ